MQFPAFLYGRSKDVRRQCRRIATQLKRGKSWGEATGADSIDTTDRLGLIVLHGPSPLLAGTEHFQAYALLKEISESSVAAEVQSRCFDACLATAWGTISLVAFDNQRWLDVPDRHAPFISSVLRFWDDFVAVGDRYSFGEPFGKPLWSVPSTIHFVLARGGVGQEKLNQPLPPGGLRELVQSGGFGLE